MEWKSFNVSSFSTIFNNWSTKNRFKNQGNIFFHKYPNDYLLGTTALHNMLSQHPDLHPSKKSLTTYEELQFFSNDKIYLNGIDWCIKKNQK